MSLKSVKSVHTVYIERDFGNANRIIAPNEYPHQTQLNPETSDGRRKQDMEGDRVAVGNLKLAGTLPRLVTIQRTDQVEETKKGSSSNFSESQDTL